MVPGVTEGPEVGGEPILRARGLVFSRGGQTILNGVDLEATAGARVAVVGRSGAGKTTLLRLLAGLERPEKGEIQLGCGTRRVRVGLVFQDLALFPHMRVWANVAFSLLVKGTDRRTARRRAEAALQVAGMGHLGSRVPSSLSGGERQRVALLRTLLSEPDVVLLDEPFANLDAHLIQHFSAWLGEQQRRTGVALVMVTHDVRFAMAWAEHMILLDEGRSVQAGSPAEIYQQPVSEFAASFTGACTLLDATVVDPDLREMVVPAVAPQVSFPVEYDDVTNRVRSGDNRRIVVRPQDVGVRRRERREGDVIGVVQSVSFMSGVTTCTVRLPSGAALTGIHAEPSAPPTPSRSAEAVVIWPPRRAVALP
ncbi:MAG: ABC transporter ATP-binding protein [Kineosporiaceae bacterium]